MPRKNFEELADQVIAARHDMNAGIGAIGGNLAFSLRVLE